MNKAPERGHLPCIKGDCPWCEDPAYWKAQYEESQRQLGIRRAIFNTRPKHSAVGALLPST